MASSPPQGLKEKVKTGVVTASNAVITSVGKAGMKYEEKFPDGITMSKAVWIFIGCSLVITWFIVMVFDAQQTKGDKYAGLQRSTTSSTSPQLTDDEKAAQKVDAIIATQVRKIRSTWAFMKNNTRMADALKSLRFWLLLLLFPFVFILFIAFHKVFASFKTATVSAMAIVMGGLVTGICLFIWIQSARRNQT